MHSNYDLTLVSSASIAPIYAEAFGQPVETISAAFGIPRTDALLPSPRRDAEERAVRERLGLRDGRTTILYAPTFRGADLKGAAAPELLDIAALHRALGSEYRLILRLHPFVKSAMRIPPEVGDFVVDASAEPDVNEVMLAGDILVSLAGLALQGAADLGRRRADQVPGQGGVWRLEAGRPARGRRRG